MKAESILLEPVYEYRLEIPPETVGRAISDIQRMQGSFAGPEQEGDMAVLTGSAPGGSYAGLSAGSDRLYQRMRPSVLQPERV